ncbi:MAG: hypothetical protein LBM97_01280 [Candidatus Nomurabacteria bacterium]|jgi:hypothetical protein|nr:hypothetical protein [Candidatus Nomurabacteria bacterium]
MVEKNAVVDNGEVKTLGILSLVLAFFVTIAGLVIGIIGVNKAKKFKAETGKDADGAGIAQAGFIVSLVFTILGVVGAIVGVIFGLVLAAGAVDIIDKVCEKGYCSSDVSVSENETDGKCSYSVTGEDWSASFNSDGKCEK